MILWDNLLKIVETITIQGKIDKVEIDKYIYICYYESEN